jgi:hypothetical protein
MPIYDRSVRELVKEFVREQKIQKGQVFSRESVISWFSAKYPKIKRGTVYAHLLLLSTNKGSRVHHKPRPDGQDDFLFQIGRSDFRLYDAVMDPAPKYEFSGALTRASQDFGVENDLENSESDTEEDDNEYSSTGEFAYEKDLKNYLSKNLGSVESGLRLYEEDGIIGIEFPVGGRYIDILAKDKNGNLVVIELKVSKGYDRVIGQILRYMGWIEKNLADTDQQVRGIIVASHITEDLILATSRLQGVDLIEYRLSLEFKKIV